MSQTDWKQDYKLLYISMLLMRDQEMLFDKCSKAGYAT